MKRVEEKDHEYVARDSASEGFVESVDEEIAGDISMRRARAQPAVYKSSGPSIVSEKEQDS